MPALFDSRCPEHRTPFGAVPAGTEVLFRICLPRDWGCHAAALQVRTPDGATEQWNMFWAGMAGDDHEWWDVRYTPAKPALYWYGFRLETVRGIGFLVRRPDATAEYAADPDPMWQLTCYAPEFHTPDWFPGGILYQIFPDRFCRSGQKKETLPAGRILHEKWDEPLIWQANGQGKILNNDFFGGDLPGITEKLDYLAGLGVTCLYLNPIFEAHSNHRYNTADYTAIDPLLGREEDFRDLTRKAASRGIRVILDGVFSHTGDDSIYFNRQGRYPAAGAYQSQSAEYASWYRFRHWPDDYACWWGIDTLPEVEEEDPSFLRYITGPGGVLERWLAAGAAGWRLDVADELPDGFLDAVRRRVKQTDPDALVMGEVWEDASNKESYGHRRRYLLGDQLDSVMNYPFRRAILRFLLNENRTAFFEQVLTVTEHYPPPVLHALMNHIGTHDTERVLTVLGGEPSAGRGRYWQSQQHLTPEQRQVGFARLRLATLMQYSLPGVPSIYYGDEAGMEGYQDPFNRNPYPWGNEDRSLVEWYRRLGQERLNCPALVRGDFIPVPSGEDVVCYYRQDGDSRLLCAVNRSFDGQTVELPGLPGAWRTVLGDGTVAGMVLTLPPLGGVWMREV